ERECSDVGPDAECALGSDTEFQSDCKQEDVRLCVPVASVDADDDAGNDDATSDDPGNDDAGNDDQTDPSTCDDPASIQIEGECMTCDDARANEESAFEALTERGELFTCERHSECVLVFAATPCTPHCSVGVSQASA